MNMKNNILPLLLICIFAHLHICTFAQSVAINTDGSAAHTSAILDVKSVNKGMLAPRMTTAQRTAIATPAAGLLVYDTDTNSFWYYNGSAWSNLSASGIGGSGTTNFVSKFSAANTIGNSQLFDDGTNIGINNATPVGKLHIKGSADVSQFIIDANSTQSNTNPLIKLRKSDGTDLMWIHSNNPNNTFIGINAGRVNSSDYNTFIGSQAAYSNTTGFSNTANGFQSLYSNTKGYRNTANGVDALYLNTTASENTAIGVSALFSQSFSNINSQWVSANTAVGYQALFSNQPDDISNGIANTAVGHSALRANTTGWDNTAVGVSALYTNNIGGENTAIGRQTLFYNTTGFDNTATGYKALRGNTIGYQNTANGTNALLNSTGNNNTAIGAAALSANNTGSDNTAIGLFALSSNTTGNNNTAIGLEADVSTGALTNATAIGNFAIVNASNKIRLGNGSVTVIEGNVAFTPSDGRFKKDINDNVPGLNFIMALHPVYYHFEAKKFDAFLMQNQAEKIKNLDKVDYTEAEKIIHNGFIAQEVEQLVKSKGYKFDAVHGPTNPTDNYSIAYSEFVVPLVKAMQEQQTIIEKQQQQIDMLLKRIEALEKK
jgi:hypothetical protein